MKITPGSRAKHNAAVTLGKRRATVAKENTESKVGKKAAHNAAVVLAKNKK